MTKLPPNEEIDEAIKELQFILSGEYSPNCGCEHCKGIMKTLNTALSVLQSVKDGSIFMGEEEVTEFLVNCRLGIGGEYDWRAEDGLFGGINCERLAQALTHLKPVKPMERERIQNIIYDFAPEVDYEARIKIADSILSTLKEKQNE